MEYNEQLNTAKGTLRGVVQWLLTSGVEEEAIIEALMDETHNLDAIAATKTLAGGLTEGVYEVTQAVSRVGTEAVRKVEDEQG